MNRIEILSDFGRMDPVFRAKIMGIRRALRDRYRFEGFTRDQPCAAVMLRLSLVAPSPPERLAALKAKAEQCPMHLFVPDLEPRHLPQLQALDGIVSHYIVPTPEMRVLLRFLVRGSVVYLADPIDFHLHAPQLRQHSGPGDDAALRAIWFGYPESFNKSMLPLRTVFAALAERQRAVLNVVTRAETARPTSYGSVVPYHPSTLLAEFDRNDVAVLSHLAFDLSLNTHHKSENKAVLAISRGLPVVASRTPAYTRLLSRYGLQDYLFDSRAGLRDALERLRVPAERNRYLAVTQAAVQHEYGIARIAAEWMRTLAPTPQTPAGK